jgi:nucleoside-diphosphate-sugar epimerase
MEVENEMKLLVTGGAGRLGTELIRNIIARGYSVRAFDLSQVPWEVLKEIPDVEVFKGNITYPDNVSEACEGVDGVLHLAALLPPRTEANRDLTMRVNVEGTRNIIEALKVRPETPLIFASSISTYGPTADEQPPIRESSPQIAHDNYSKSKIEAERIVTASDTPYVVLRIAPIAVADLIELPDIIPYRADQRVEFVYVGDAAWALYSAFEKKEALSGTFNIAGGESWQMTGVEYIEGFYRALGVDIEPRFSEVYTAIDWYDTSKGRFLGYQRVTFNGFIEKLRAVAEQLGLR